MKSKLFLFILLFTTAILAQGKSPKIHSDIPTKDFGEIKEGELLKFNFTVKNNGGENLKILKVRASCGCTAAEPAKKILAPGDSTNILVTFNSSHRSGLQRKHVYIYSNDPDNPQYRLSFTANVVNPKIIKMLADGPRIYFPTNNYNFGTVESGTIVSGKLSFKNIGNKALRIIKVEPSAKYISSTIASNEIKPGNSGELTIKFDSSKRIGKITRTVGVYSNDATNELEIITIYINIVSKEK